MALASVLKTCTEVLMFYVIYVLPLCKNLKRLESEMSELSTTEEAILSEEKKALQSRKKKRAQNLDHWLQSVKRVKKDLDYRKEVGIFQGLKCIWNGCHSEHMIQRVEKLNENGSFLQANGMLVETSLGRGQQLPAEALVGITYEGIVKKILEFIQGGIGRIGVYGMSGVGKTFVLKHVNNCLLEMTDLCTYVFWVPVSKTFSIEKLQDDIAKVINLDLSEDKDQTRRAAKLFQKLSHLNKYVIIFDDVWKQIPLEHVGIPEPTVDIKSTLIFAARSADVCQSMYCSEKIRMNLLSKQESWKFLLCKTECQPPFREIAKLVANECAPSPHILSFMAGRLWHENDTHGWEHTLNEMKKSASTSGSDEIERCIIEQLQFSFRFGTRCLNDENIRHCFLHCTNYRKNHWILRDVLIKNFISFGLIDGVGDMDAAVHKGHVILNELESICLLEGTSSTRGRRYVKMLDWIHRVGSGMEIACVNV